MFHVIVGIFGGVGLPLKSVCVKRTVRTVPHSLLHGILTRSLPAHTRLCAAGRYQSYGGGGYMQYLVGSRAEVEAQIADLKVRFARFVRAPCLACTDA